MSEPAVFVLIRDGEKRFFEDRWADAFLFREILWGPDELERWLTESEEIDDWADEASGGVVVDFDNRRMVWYGDEAMLEIPRVASAYDQLLQASWSGFDVEFGSRGMVDLAAAAGQSDVDDYDDESEERCSTVRQAIGYYDDDDQDAEYDDEPENEYDDDDTRAWITLVDSEGAVRHRNVDAISDDLIRGQESAIAQLADLPDAEIPRESVVTEGMWIDQPRREIGFWGGRLAKASFPKMRQSWGGWTVRWAEQGYADQCAVSGPAGIPMSDAEALGTIAPTILSIKRFDMGTMFNVMGGHLKRSAIRATGCLWMVLCAPVLLFGAISGNWNAALITVAIVALFVIAAFKVVENKFRKTFSMSGLGQENDAEDSRAPVAGPIDESERRQRLEQLLTAAGFPPLAEIEPHFSDRPSIDDLL
jgi:hypothetical protein